MAQDQQHEHRHMPFGYNFDFDNLMPEAQQPRALPGPPLLTDNESSLIEDFFTDPSHFGPSNQTNLYSGTSLNMSGLDDYLWGQKYYLTGSPYDQQATSQGFVRGNQTSLGASGMLHFGTPYDSTHNLGIMNGMGAHNTAPEDYTAGRILHDLSSSASHANFAAMNPSGYSSLQSGHSSLRQPSTPTTNNSTDGRSVQARLSERMYPFTAPPAIKREPDTPTSYNYAPEMPNNAAMGFPGTYRYGSDPNIGGRLYGYRPLENLEDADHGQYVHRDSSRRRSTHGTVADRAADIQSPQHIQQMPRHQITPAQLREQNIPHSAQHQIHRPAKRQRTESSAVIAPYSPVAVETPARDHSGNNGSKFPNMSSSPVEEVLEAEDDDDDDNDVDDPVPTGSKRRKSSGSASASRSAAQRKNLTDEEKRRNHIASEKKRREKQKASMDCINEMVPALRAGNLSRSQALEETSNYIEDILSGNAKAESFIAKLKAKQQNGGGSEELDTADV